MSTPTFLFIGFPGSGKSTAAKMCAALACVKHGETSDIVYDVLAKRLGLSVERLRKIPKEQIRPALIDVGDELCWVNPAALSYFHWSNGCRVISGIRRPEELHALCDVMDAAKQRYVIVWVSRPGCVKPDKDNTEVTPDDADRIIVNDGEPSALWKKLERFVDQQARSSKPSLPFSQNTTAHSCPH